MEGLARLLSTHSADGRIDWIGLRPARLEPVVPVAEASVTPSGLEGDHARPGKRAMTLIQAEHLPVISALARREVVTPDLLRRNLVISGINLAALRHARLRLGGAIIAISGPCPPCSRMERALGPGGYNAMRGHGGWYADVITPGLICAGDVVTIAGAAA